jgi:N-acetylneuraminic acid mutarotase
LYDPFGTPNAQGNLQLGLHTGWSSSGSAAVINGQLAYFTGGNGVAEFLEYNVATNTTRALASVPDWQQNSAMTMCSSGNVLTCGGNNGHAISSIYAPATNTWTISTPLPVDMGNFAMATVNGMPFVFGGWTGNAALNTVYSLNANVWTAQAPLPVTLHDHRAAASTSTTAMVCGGMTTRDQSSVQAACYTYTANAWTTAAPMNTARHGHGMCEYKGSVYVYGGNNINNEKLASVEQLATGASAWTTLPAPMFAADVAFASVPLPV